jgi:serine/threonine protein kinase
VATFHFANLNDDLLERERYLATMIAFSIFLRDLYEEEEDSFWISRGFPFIVSILPEGDSEECHFEYLSVIENHQEVFKVKVNGQLAYLKFIQCKSQLKDAIAIQNELAEELWAPRILKSKSGNPLVQYLPVGYAMIIEEDLEGFTSCADFILKKENAHLAEGFMKLVKKKVLDYLASKNIVHGDLRFTNILISPEAQLVYATSKTIPDGGLRIIDFEFSGYEGTNFELGKLVGSVFCEELFSGGKRMRKHDELMMNHDIEKGRNALHQRDDVAKRSVSAEESSTGKKKKTK